MLFDFLFIYFILFYFFWFLSYLHIYFYATLQLISNINKIFQMRLLIINFNHFWFTNVCYGNTLEHSFLWNLIEFIWQINFSQLSKYDCLITAVLFLVSHVIEKSLKKIKYNFLTTVTQGLFCETKFQLKCDKLTKILKKGT